MISFIGRKISQSASDLYAFWRTHFEGNFEENNIDGKHRKCFIITHRVQQTFSHNRSPIICFRDAICDANC